MTEPRDHGGGIDAAAAHWGGARADWIDLSTGINPVPYPIPDINQNAWTALPDKGAEQALLRAARRFWAVPEGLDLLAAPGASALIAAMPRLGGTPGTVTIPAPTYNEHAAAFRNWGWEIGDRGRATVVVHPNNPDGRLWRAEDLPTTGLLVIDESFCDIAPEQSLVGLAATRPRTIVLKSFGKFWGLAGLRLGFAIGARADLTLLQEAIGPWAVSGPALAVGTAALGDPDWAAATRSRLATDSARLDDLVTRAGAAVVGGTSLFRLYETKDAESFQDRLARAQIWSRIFPYSRTWVRLGVPGRPEHWERLDAALA